MDQLQIPEHHIEVERKIIHLMLNHLETIADILDSGYGLEFFDTNHHLLLSAIWKEYNDGRRLLTKTVYQHHLIQQGQKKKLMVELEIYAKCYIGISADTNELGMLKDQLVEIYATRKVKDSLQAFNNNSPQGFFTAANEMANSLQSALALADIHKPIYSSVAELKSEYLQLLEYQRANPASVIRCGISEIDDPISVGFRPMQLTLFVADVGNHKCVPGYAVCYLKDGSRIRAEDLYRDFCSGNNNEILSLNEKSLKVYNQKVGAVFDNGKKECFRVTTQMGFESEATSNHPYLTMSGYKKLRELNNGDSVAISRKQMFGNTNPDDNICRWLGGMYSDGGTTQSIHTFSNIDTKLVREMRSATRELGGKFYQKTIHNKPIKGDYAISNMQSITRRYGLYGKRAIEKVLHPEIFSWNQQSLKIFLAMMYGCDGSFVVCKKFKRYAIIYSSSSKELAIGVRDLLLKFSVVASISRLDVKYRGNIHPNWQVKIRDVEQIIKFIKTIGFIGKKEKYATKYIPELLQLKPNRNNDTIPSEIWTVLRRKFKEYNMSHYCCRRLLKEGGDKGKEGHCGVSGKAINRSVLVKIAQLLNNDEELMNISTSDIVWDKITSIESTGKHQTFDISMKSEPNFVTDNFVTHNTNVMLNIALALVDRGHEVLFIPLEMSRFDLMNRILCNRLNLSMGALASPNKLTEEEFTSLKASEIWDKGLKLLHILDSDERTTVSFLKRQIEEKVREKKPKVVIIDYIDNLQPDTMYGQKHIEVGDIIKALRFLGRRYDFHIISAAQMNRTAIKALREGKEEAVDSTSIYGSHLYSADSDNIFALMKVKGEDTRLKIYTIKSRYGPSGQTKELQVNAARCLISSTDGMMELTGDSGLDMYESMNTPVEKISSSEVEFTSSLDIPDDDLGGL